MAVVVIGGGAIGLLVAGGLIKAGEQVGLIGRDSTRRALSDRPLYIAWPKETTTIDSLRVATHPNELPSAFQRPDLAIVCVKGYDTATTFDTLAALQPKAMLTLQNGIGNEELLIKRFGPEPIISGAITTSVEPDSPSRITVTKMGGIGLAKVGLGHDLKPWIERFEKAGLPTNQYPSYQAMKWSKALLNMLGNATAAILDMSVAEVYKNQSLVELEREAFLEALAVMKHQQWKPVNLPRYPAKLLAMAMDRLPPLLLYPILRNRVGGGRGGKDPSLLRDMRAGRARSEGEFLYGAIAREASRLKLPAQVNGGIWRVLATIASGAEPWDTYRQRPDRLIKSVRDPFANNSLFSR